MPRFHDLENWKPVINEDNASAGTYYVTASGRGHFGSIIASGPYATYQQAKEAIPEVTRAITERDFWSESCWCGIIRCDKPAGPGRLQQLGWLAAPSSAEEEEKGHEPD